MLKRTYKYRLYPTKAQETLLKGQLSSCRYLYNHFLEQRRTAYEKDKTRITCFDQIKQIPQLKGEKPELNEIYSQVLQDVPRRLDKAFQNFFRRVTENKNGKNQKPGYPRFKGKNRYDSLVYPQSGFELQDNKLYPVKSDKVGAAKPQFNRVNLSKIGPVTIILHREIQGTIKTLTIQRTSTHKWYACFSVEINQAFPNKTKIEHIKHEHMIGIDVGLNSFVTTSNGDTIDNPRYLRKSEQKLGKIQRKHSQKKLKSKNRNKSRLKVAALHEKITNQRTDFLHQLSRHLINNFQFIAFEKLNISGMVRNKYLSKSIADASWGTFLQMLTYKAEEAGVWAQGVNPQHTSQICSNCQKTVPKSLATRIHKCPDCNLTIDRDINAAKNVLTLGLNTVGTTGINACEVEGLPSTVKQEALTPSGVE
ncbi:transposase [Patescibacteria group bacterium AH-259-L07]|nr:transposase [Patescibacteria group bacterium AH-259-L07]